MIEGSKNSNFYGVKLPYSAQELMALEARKTRIEAIKRELGDKYLLAPLYGRIQSPKL
jgi:hypothetical protein